MTNCEDEGKKVNTKFNYFFIVVTVVTVLTIVGICGFYQKLKSKTHPTSENTDLETGSIKTDNNPLSTKNLLNLDNRSVKENSESWNEFFTTTLSDLHLKPMEHSPFTNNNSIEIENIRYSKSLNDISNIYDTDTLFPTDIVLNYSLESLQNVWA
ncbi:hypothetical protein SNEBB_001098 [Seison nebaliae]|nr:hypothetical protein SNEBB_001098 [Seison nebaliae]